MASAPSTASRSPRLRTLPPGTPAPSRRLTSPRSPRVMTFCWNSARRSRARRRFARWTPSRPRSRGSAAASARSFWSSMRAPWPTCAAPSTWPPPRRRAPSHSYSPSTPPRSRSAARSRAAGIRRAAQSGGPAQDPRSIRRRHRAVAARALAPLHQAPAPSDFRLPEPLGAPRPPDEGAGGRSKLLLIAAAVAAVAPPAAATGTSPPAKAARAGGASPDRGRRPGSARGTQARARRRRRSGSARRYLDRARQGR